MSYIPKPSARHPGAKKNAIGLSLRDYEGPLSTLCGGCGHDSVTAALVQSFFELSISPHQVAKMSGIGCSSKTPGYFLSQAHGFNGVHGRMPSVTTGANAAEKNMIYLGISGDGDTGSIGIGQYMHAVRRRLNMLYVIENNGVYGLTKGQFSATSDLGAMNKKGQINPFNTIDPVQIGILLGASFVARSFSGDKAQLVPLMKAALRYKGFALIDVISPCVTFNNHEGSSRSYGHTRDHILKVNGIDLVPQREKIEISMGEGSMMEIPLHGEEKVRLRKLDADYDCYDAARALAFVEEHRRKGEIVTGLLYCEKQQKDMHDVLETPKKALRDFSYEDLCPGQEGVAEFNKNHR